MITDDLLSPYGRPMPKPNVVQSVQLSNGACTVFKVKEYQGKKGTVEYTVTYGESHHDT